MSQTHTYNIKIDMSNKRVLWYVIAIAVAIINFSVVKIWLVKIWQIHGHLPNYPIVKVSLYTVCTQHRPHVHYKILYIVFTSNTSFN